MPDSVRNVVLQLMRRAVLSVGIASLVASTLRAAGLGTNTEYETGGWRDARDDELLAPTKGGVIIETIDLTSRTSESV